MGKDDPFGSGSKVLASARRKAGICLGVYAPAPRKPAMKKVLFVFRFPEVFNQGFDFSKRVD